MAEAVCALDAGTSAVKAALIAPDGTILHCTSLPAPPAGPPDSLLAFDPAAYYQAVTEVLQDLAHKGAADGIAIRALCAATQRATILGLDATGEAVCAFSWTDSRGGEGIADLEAGMGAEAFYLSTGLSLSSLLSLGKILWLRHHHSEAFTRVRRWSLLHDALLHRLGAAGFVVDRSNAACTGLLDMHAATWHPDLLAPAGVRADMLPTLKPAGSVAGALSSAAAQRTGLPAGLPLVVGGGDQEVAALGLGAGTAGTVAINLGTSATVCCSAEEARLDLHSGRLCLPHVLPGHWLHEAFQISFASALHWCETLTGQRGVPAAEPSPAQASPPPPVFVPFLSRVDPTAPESAHGLLAGLCPDHTAADLTRGVLRGVLAELRHLYEALVDGMEVRRVCVGGGPLARPGLADELATALDRPIEVLQDVEATLAGAACLAWCGSGHYREPRAAQQRFTQASQTVRPATGEAGDAARRSYQHWRAAVHRSCCDAATAAADLPVATDQDIPAPYAEELEPLRSRALAFAGIGMYRYTYDGTILYMDRQALRILEVEDLYPDPAAVVGKNVSDLLQYAKSPGSLRKATRTAGQVPLYEYPFVTLRGRHKWSLHDSYLVRDPVTGQDAIQVMARDITELKQKEQHLRDANEQLQAANQELGQLDQLKTDLLSNVSHELRSPLVSIKGYSHLLLDGDLGPVTPLQADKLQVILRNTQRVVDLVNELLDFSRLSQGLTTLERRPTSLDPILDLALDQVRTRARTRQIHLAVTRPGRPMRLEADDAKLAQVLINLLDNAIKFSEEKQTVWLQAQAEDGGLLIRIADEGAGIPEDALPRIFDRFYQVDASSRRRFRGLGIGLSLCRDIVAAHGGRIAAASELGKGSTFTLWLPQGDAGGTPPTDQEPAPATADSAADWPAGKVLVVDDDPEIRAFLAETLRRHGMEVRLAASGAEALQHLHKTLPDVVLLDIAMADMNGYETCRAIRALPAERPLPILLVSAVPEREVAPRMAALGADGFVQKPFAPEELRRALHRALR